ncbi:MAG: putative NADPH-dependent reductase [Dactylosporangium sp.]|nr:putative NADPH-dependent reductase [Dactylosporangium sp.]
MCEPAGDSRWVRSGELDGKPVAWMNVANPGRATDAHASLETVLGYVGAVVIEGACVRVPVARDAVGVDGVVADPEVRAGIAEVLATIARHVNDKL